MAAVENLHGGVQIFDPWTRYEGPLLEEPGGSASLPFISVIIPTWCDETHIAACLDSILKQDYPLYRMEILVSDGLSTDATPEIVRRYARDYPQVRLLDNEEQLLSAGMNRAIQVSQGSIIVRVDVRSEYPPNYIRKCMETLRLTGADNVGGPRRPRARTHFQQAVAAARESVLEVEGEPAPAAAQDGYVESVYPGAFRRETLQRVGLFDPGAVDREDIEINQRILAAGGKIYLNSAIESYYCPAANLRALAARYFECGRGRARTALKHGRFQQFRSLAPSCAAWSLAVLVLLGLLAPVVWWALLAAGALYLGTAATEALRLSLRHGPHALWLLPPLFLTMHLAQATGVTFGLCYYACNPDWNSQRTPMLT